MEDAWAEGDLYMVAFPPRRKKPIASASLEPLVGGAWLHPDELTRTYRNKKHAATVMHSRCDVPLSRHVCRSRVLSRVFVVVANDLDEGSSIYHVADTREDAEAAMAVCVGLWPKLIAV